MKENQPISESENLEIYTCLIEGVPRNYPKISKFEENIQTGTQKKNFENKLKNQWTDASVGKNIRNTNMQNWKANILETCLENQYFSIDNEFGGIAFLDEIWELSYKMNQGPINSYLSKHLILGSESQEKWNNTSQVK